MERDKRYLVFGFDTYYPGPGLEQIKASFDTPEEAFAFIKSEDAYYDYYEVYDRIEGVEVEIPY